MIQLFIKSSKITSQDWDNAYQRIESIVASFPIKLLRVESFNKYKKDLDKDHFDLRKHKDSAEECICFYGDFMSLTAGSSVYFYKNWEKHKELALKNYEKNYEKPITWYPYIPFKNDGSLPETNGASTKNDYIDTNEALYEYAIIAIGIMLENLFLDNAFIIPHDQNYKTITKIVEWLEVHFNENFELPIYFDKKRLLATLTNAYDEKKDIACRFEHLYRKQYKRNMEFALQNIGYEPTFDFYAEVLSDTWFGTFGFADVLDAWISASQDLEKTLELVAKSKELTLERNDKNSKEYDLTYILKKLLGSFILWTPMQREELAFFYTNKKALETGKEDLFGSMMRMTGNRVDICPMYATEEELFEAFMYNDPKNGAVFKQIIEDWIIKNVDAFDNLKQKLAEVNSEIDNSDNLISESTDLTDNFSVETFIREFPSHEQFLIQKVVERNPVYPKLEKSIEVMRERLWELMYAEKHQEHIQSIFNSTKEEKISYIHRRIKDVGMSVCPFFEQWLDAENDDSVLSNIFLLLSLKLYDRNLFYVRYRVLWERKYWNLWQKGEIYAV